MTPYEQGYYRVLKLAFLDPAEALPLASSAGAGAAAHRLTRHLSPGMQGLATLGGAAAGYLPSSVDLGPWLEQLRMAVNPPQEPLPTEEGFQ